MLDNKLWVERYRPKTLDEYVFTDEGQRSQVQAWIKEGSIPHLLLWGEAGVGKTTLAKVLINELGVESLDVLEINASRENSVDIVRNKLINFIQTVPFGKFKIVLLDEVDYTSTAFQAALRSDMETYADTVRFIMTCNYPNKVIPAIRSSRCFSFEAAKPDITEFTARAATILVKEGIDFDLEVLDEYVKATYPDLRRCLNQLQEKSKTGKLLVASGATTSDDAMLVEAVELFKKGKVIDGRKQILQYLSLYPSRIESIYMWMYNNLNLWGDTNEKRDAAILVIRNGLVNLTLVGIPEIALSASLVELTSL
jgi:replication factor C small subunit